MNRIRWNLSEYRRILRSSALERVLLGIAEKGAASANRSLDGEDGYIAVSSVGENRARAAVVADSVYARRDNAEDHTLLRIIDDMRA